jgi:hypothetical protein
LKSEACAIAARCPKPIWEIWHQTAALPVSVVRKLAVPNFSSL